MNPENDMLPVQIFKQMFIQENFILEDGLKATIPFLICFKTVILWFWLPTNMDL